MASAQIVDYCVIDVRFPTSREAHGSDAMHADPDYSAAYVILRTNQPGLEGHGLTFTLGRGTEVCVKAVDALAQLVVGRQLQEIEEDWAGFYRQVTCESQLRWLGPEKGVIHLASAAVINAAWDLVAKAHEKPLWQYVSDMSSEQMVAAIDFRYLSDALPPAAALDLLQDLESSRAERLRHLETHGYPAYTTSAGWLGYSDEHIRELCRAALEQGWEHFKIKVGRHRDDDLRRSAIIREEIGPERRLMMDANQVWDVGQAIEEMRHLAAFDPWWIEEPTSPDDILGHAAIAREIAPIRVATGEQCHNRVMFKQFLQADAMQVCQIDSCRLGSIPEILAVMLLAKQFDVPVCPHAGGVGLCEYVNHLIMIDYLRISGSLEHRIAEYVDHLHEHFVDPVVMQRGAYTLPQAPGYSITMKAESLEHYRYPDGPAWQS